MSITVTIPGAVETTVGATAPATLVLELGVPGPTGATGTAGATGAGVAAGGTTGQALVKVSATNYDTTWTTPVSSVAGRTGAVTLAVADVSGAAPIAAPTFTGVVTIPSGALISGYLTTTAGDAAYVPINGAGGTPTSITLTNASGTAASLTAGSVTTNANLTGVVTSTGNATAIADAALSIGKTSGLQAALDLKSPLASPTFTGTPLSTTPSININTTQIATTAFVRDMLSDCTWSVPPLTTCLSGTSGTGAVIIAASLDSVWTQGPNINTAGYAQKGMQMFARSNSTYGFNYTKEMRIACKMAIAWTNSFTAITYTLIQRLGNSGNGALGVVGFGITINMATKVLSIVAHNGTTLTTKTTSWVAPTTGIASIDFMVKSDGTGTVYAYADGVLIDSTTGMATTTTSTSTSMFAAVEINSAGGTSTANATGYNANLRTFVAHG